MLNEVVNIKRKPTPHFDLYMGRENKYLGLEQSKWHNPFPMKAEYERYGCLEKFYEYAVKQDKLIADLYELDGKILGCYCSPRFCHSHIWLYLRSKQKQELPWKNKFIDEIQCRFVNFGI